MPFRGTQALRVVLSALLLVAVLAAVAEADWEFSTPEDLGMDSARLEAMTEAIEALELPIDTIVVALHGRIAGGGPEAELLRPSPYTLLVNEYGHRYGDFDGFFTRSNVTLLTEATENP